VTFTLVQSASDTVVNLSAYGLGTDTYRNMEGVLGSGSADSITGSGLADTIYGGAGNDTLSAGGGDDWIQGEGGDDSLTGGAGADQFRYAASADDVDVITDFAVSDDKIAIDTGFVDLGNTTATVAGATLGAGSYFTAASIAAISSSHDNGVVEISASQTSTDIQNTTISGARDLFALVHNSTTGRGELWFDTDWNNTGSRVKLATFDNITTLVGITDFTNGNFLEFA